MRKLEFGLALVMLMVLVSMPRGAAPGGDHPPTAGRAQAAAAPAPPGAVGATKSKQPDPRVTASHDPLTPLRSYRDIDPSDRQTEPWLSAHDGSPLDMEFLIATVPDPLDSRFGYNFDSTLDAIQMAIESQGYVLDRYWLPWWPSGR